MRRIRKFPTKGKAKILGKAFIDSQFNYVPLLWITFVGKLLKIEKILRKTLKVNYESNNTYDNLLLQGISHLIALRLMSKKNNNIQVKSSYKFVSVIDSSDHCQNKFSPL